MKIAVVAPLPPIRGGIARHSHNVVEALVAAGHEVAAFTWVRQYPRLLYRRSEVDPHLIPTAGAQPRLHWAKPWTWRRVGVEIGGSCDLLYMPWVTPFHAVPYRILTDAAGVPTVFVVHNATPHEWFPATAGLTRWVLGRAHYLIAHSTAVKADLERFGVDIPTTVVPHPSNLDLAPTPPPPGPPRRLLFVGFVRPYKGLDLLVEAMAHLPEDFTVTVAGEFWVDRAGIDELAARLGLTERLRLVDRYIPDAELAELLADHHLVVAPYRSATQSGIVPLAFAAGRPVVCTSVGGLVEAVDDGINGVLTEPAPESIAAGILRAEASYPTLVSGVQNTRWSWSDVATTIVDAALSR